MFSGAVNSFKSWYTDTIYTPYSTLKNEHKLKMAAAATLAAAVAAVALYVFGFEALPFVAVLSGILWYNSWKSIYNSANPAAPRANNGDGPAL